MKKLVKLFLILSLLIGCATGFEKTPPEWGTFPTHWHIDGQPVFLKWKHSPGSDVTGYMLYWGCHRCKKYVKVGGRYEMYENDCEDNVWLGNKSLGYVSEYDFPVDPKFCSTYMFALTAHDRDGTESDRSKVKLYNTGKLNNNITPPGVILTSWDRWDGTEYSTSDTLTMTWDIMPNTNYYEIQMIHTDDSDHQTTYNMGTTVINSITVTRPRAGHFIAMVRGCNTAGCSTWSQSIDPTYAIVDGNPGAWRVYWRLAPPIWEDTN